MINILLPMTGKMTFDSEDYGYPKPLIEINGKTMLERAIEPLQNINEPKRFIAVIRSSDVQAFNFDYVLKQVVHSPLELLVIQNPTKGALCTALLAIDIINNDIPLIISSVDHVIDSNINNALATFQDAEFDAGTICFKSVHPKWSFVRTDENGNVVETAEKRPISSYAIAGFYYFHKGMDFVNAAMDVIRKGADTQGSYFVSSSLNELILQGKRLGIHEIPNNRYYNFYDASAIKAYEVYLGNSLFEDTTDIHTKSDLYRQAVVTKDLALLNDIFATDIGLHHTNEGYKLGRASVLEVYSKLFDTHPVTKLTLLRSIKERHCVALEFISDTPQGQIHILDILMFQQGQISEINSFYRKDQ